MISVDRKSIIVFGFYYAFFLIFSFCSLQVFLVLICTQVWKGFFGCELAIIDIAWLGESIGGGQQFFLWRCALDGAIPDNQSMIFPDLELIGIGQVGQDSESNCSKSS